MDDEEDASGRAHSGDFPDPATHHDPIERLPWQQSPRAPIAPLRRDPEAVGAVVAFAAAIGAVVLLRGPWILLSAVLPLLALLAARVHHDLFAGVNRWVRLVGRRAPGMRVDWTEVPEPTAGRVSAARLSIDLPPAPHDGAPFDPSEDGHRRAAHALHRARTRDGLALEGQGTLTVWEPVLERARQVPASARVDDWATAAIWLAGRADRRRAWLMASAWAERSRWHRVRTALEQLDGDPSALGIIEASGAWVARAGAAVYCQRPDRVDGIIAEAGRDPAASPETLVALLDARFEFEGAPIDTWVADPGLSPALVRLEIERLAPRHWRALVDSPDIAVAAIAADKALRLPPPTPIEAARALLDHPALPSLGSLWARGPLTPTVERCLSRLAAQGDARDVPRMGRWARVTGEQYTVTRYLDTLKARLADVPDAGRLALSDAPGGHLSVARRAAGELTLAAAADDGGTVTPGAGDRRG